MGEHRDQQQKGIGEGDQVGSGPETGAAVRDLGTERDHDDHRDDRPRTADVDGHATDRGEA